MYTCIKSEALPELTSTINSIVSNLSILQWQVLLTYSGLSCALKYDESGNNRIVSAIQKKKLFSSSNVRFHMEWFLLFVVAWNHIEWNNDVLEGRKKSNKIGVNWNQECNP